VIENSASAKDHPKAVSLLPDWARSCGESDDRTVSCESRRLGRYARQVVLFFGDASLDEVALNCGQICLQQTTVAIDVLAVRAEPGKVLINHEQHSKIN
jgi:hypothetical protein